MHIMYARNYQRKEDTSGSSQDADAIAASTKRLEPFKDKVTIVRDNYVKVVYYT